MNEPTTAAGRALLDRLMGERFLRETTKDFEWPPESEVVTDILAIEAEAAALDMTCAHPPGRRWVVLSLLVCGCGEIIGKSCPVRSSITDGSCFLPDGHPCDRPTRFHRYAATPWLQRGTRE